MASGSSVYIDIEARDKTEQAFHKVGNSFESLEKQARDVQSSDACHSGSVGTRR